MTDDGEALGAHELPSHDWPIGSVIHRETGPDLRVVDFIDTEDVEMFAILIVAPLDDG